MRIALEDEFSANRAGLPGLAIEQTHTSSITFADKMINHPAALGQRVTGESPLATAHLFFNFKGLKTARLGVPRLERIPHWVQMPKR